MTDPLVDELKQAFTAYEARYTIAASRWMAILVICVTVATSLVVMFSPDRNLAVYLRGLSSGILLGALMLLMTQFLASFLNLSFLVPPSPRNLTEAELIGLAPTIDAMRKDSPEIRRLHEKLSRAGNLNVDDVGRLFGWGRWLDDASPMSPGTKALLSATSESGKQ